MARTISQPSQFNCSRKRMCINRRVFAYLRAHAIDFQFLQKWKKATAAATAIKNYLQNLLLFPHTHANAPKTRQEKQKMGEIKSILLAQAKQREGKRWLVHLDVWMVDTFHDEHFVTMNFGLLAHTAHSCMFVFIQSLKVTWIGNCSWKMGAAANSTATVAAAMYSVLFFRYLCL